MDSIKALAFDIQGTAVDFYTPLMRMGAGINESKGLSIDWEVFAEEWRGLYRATMDAVIGNERPWTRVDQIYRDGLDDLLERRGLAARFSDADRDTLNAIWTRLDPWPDSVEGLTRLRRRFTLTTLSNAGMAAVVSVVKHAALPFDVVLTAELARSYKPEPAVYQLAVDYLGHPAAAIMMVACHPYDLEAAAAFGMRTAFVSRPLEFGPNKSAAQAADGTFDIHAGDFLNLADQLGA